MVVDPAGHLRVDPRPAREDEVAPVDPPQVDPARLQVVGELQQVLGRIDHVGGDPEHPAHDVGGAAGQHREREIAAGEPVRRLVEGAVPAEGDDEVESLADRLTREVGGVVGPLGLDRLDVVAAAQRVDDQVLQPARDRRRERVDDQQHPRLGPGERLARLVDSRRRTGGAGDLVDGDLVHRTVLPAAGRNDTRGVGCRDGGVALRRRLPLRRRQALFPRPVRECRRAAPRGRATRAARQVTASNHATPSRSTSRTRPSFSSRST